MRDLTDTKMFDAIIRDACRHRTLEAIYRESGYRDGYRAGVRDTERVAERPPTKETA